MSLSARISGAWKTGDMYARVSGAWKLLTPSARVGSAWKAGSGGGGGGAPMTVGLSTTSMYGTFGYSGSGSAGNNTATLSGGVGPYTYAWSRLSGSVLIGAVTPGIATTETVVSGGVPGNSYDAVFKCTVTDSTGAIAVAVVSIHFDFDGGS